MHIILLRMYDVIQCLYIHTLRAYGRPACVYATVSLDVKRHCYNSRVPLADGMLYVDL